MSLIISNIFFCTLAIYFFVLSLKCSHIIIYKRGVPIFIGLILILLRMTIPHEFYFTQTLASRTVLPFIKSIANYTIYNYTIWEAFIFVWIVVSLCLITYHCILHYKTLNIVKSIPQTNNLSCVQALNTICKQRGIKYIPKLIEWNINPSPFIIGYRDPIIVLPENLAGDALRYSLMHEIEHIRNHHLIVKVFIEFVSYVFWWNPIIWLLKKELLNSMELQVDHYLAHSMNPTELFDYASTIISIAKKTTLSQNHMTIIPFVSTNSKGIQSRIDQLISMVHSDNPAKIKQSFSAIILSIVFLLSSVLFTFEVSIEHTPLTLGTTTVDMEKSFFLKHVDGSYSLYIDGEFVTVLKIIPDELKTFKVYEE